MPGLIYDQILSRLSDVLQAASEDRLLASFANVTRDAGGTAFALIDNARTHNDPALTRGLIGLCTRYSLDGNSESFAASGESPLQPFFWNAVRVDGAHAAGSFGIANSDAYFLVDGLMAPLPLTSGPVSSVFVQFDNPRLIGEAEPWLTVFCLAFRDRLRELRGAVKPPLLSAREEQVLSWMAEGKSAEDVGEILGISAATVMFHYRNIAERFGTLNRTHTVVEAMRRGALRLRRA